MTFRDDFRRDLNEFDVAWSRFFWLLVKAWRIEWMLDKLTQAIVWCERRIRGGR